MGLFSVSVQTGNFSYPLFKNSSEITTKAITNPISVSAKVYQDDPRGHLTGRMFYGGLDDTGGDSLFEQLLLEVEVDIAQTSTYGYTVFAEIQDRGFPHTNEWGDWDETYHLKGYSGIEDLSIGLHNITVAFNCTEMRALKLPGPYFVSSVELCEFTGSDFDRFDDLCMEDHDKPLYGIYDKMFIETFDEPDETYDLTFHDAILAGDFLEVNFTFQSFSHHYEDRLYYIQLSLRNDTGSTIVHHQKIMVLSSNSVNDIVLEIPSEYLTAFKKHGGFAGNDYPTILFQEITVVQISGDYGSFDSLNMSYTAEAFPTYNINVANAAPIEVLEPEKTYNFGTMNVNDTIDFIIYPENPNDLLELQVNRIVPDGHDYEVYVVNGWGRFSNVDWGSAQFFIWSDWWDNTETKYLITLMGKYMGPWRFFVHYPDWGGTQPPQGLSVYSKFDIDTTKPDIDLQTPIAGQSISQYYGIPFKGEVSDNSYIARYELICDSQVLTTFDMMHGWSDPLRDDFSLIWFPPEDLELPRDIDITVRAIDLGCNIKMETISITIIPGTIPSPESTINKGLEWLRDNQNYDGSWNYYGDDHSAGMTALAALCFIQSGFAYESVVTDAINFLENSFENDYENPGQVIRHMSPTYETAMATIALIAYNATLPTYDRDLDLLIDDAIDWLVATQNDEDHNVDPSEPWYGGWRYGWDHESSDLSVSQWVFLALAAYRYDDPDLWDKVQTFVLRCRGGWWDEYGTFYPDGGFTYTPSTEDWRDQGGSSYGSMTAAGIWGLYLSGTKPDDPNWASIESALDWIAALPPEELIGLNPHYGDFQYYWYLTASKAFLMAGRAEDQWWYDNITNYLCTHMVYGSSSSAYWDNELGQEPPVYATVLAILSQQVFYGHIPMHELEVSLEADDGCAIYLWNSTISGGYNYVTGVEETSASTTYSGLLEDKQTVSILSPSKGEYFIDVFPVVGESGMSSPQDMILRGRALTESGHIISYKTEIIDYQYPGNYPQVLRYKMVLSTISGLDIHFLFDGYEHFDHSVSFDSISYPAYVELNEGIDIFFSLTKIGTGTISAGTIFIKGDDFADQSNDFTNWPEGEQRSFDYHYSTSGLLAGIRTIVIGLIGENTTPLLIRVKVQVGNRAPEGELDDLDSVLSGTKTISWTAFDPDGDDLTFKVILILPDGTEGLLESSTDKTSYSFDTTAYPDDTGYQIIVEISDGTDTTRLQSSFFEIRNYEETEDTEAPDIGTPGFEFTISFLTLGLIIVWFRRKK